MSARTRDGRDSQCLRHGVADSFEEAGTGPLISKDIAMTRTLRTQLFVAGIALAAAAGGAAAVTTASTAAGAAEARCVAWAQVPAQITLTSHTVLRPRLTGTAGCHAGGFDNGATATLTAAGRQPEPQRWQRFGDREYVELYRGLDRPGTYTFSGGTVQTYDADEVRVSAAWRTTTVMVRYGSRFSSVDSSRSLTRATLIRTTADGTRRAAGTRVTLQRKSGHGWKTVAAKRTSRSGTVAFTRGAGTYRLVGAASPTTWGTVTSTR